MIVTASSAEDRKQISEMSVSLPSLGRGLSGGEPFVQYRPAIDGLRAVAVLAVFIFHLKRQWLPGGFVGVDVFFVISEGVNLFV